MAHAPTSGEPGAESAIDAIGAAHPCPSRTPADISDAEERERAVLDAARQVGESVLGPNAEYTDRLNGPNRENFAALASAGLFGIAAPIAYGGSDVSPTVQRDCTRILASYCGVTTFTLAQHYGPTRMIAGAPNGRLKECLLADMAAGRRPCGISFAHLRRPGPPVLRAEAVDGGLRINGTAPWVTGWELMRHFVFGATLPDGSFVYFWSPADRAEFSELFEDEQVPAYAGAFRASAPLPLCAMNASGTVEVQLEDWFVPEAHRLSLSNRETMQRNDRSGVLGATSLALGCAWGSVRRLSETAERRAVPAILRAANSFRAEYDLLAAQVESGMRQVSPPMDFEKAVGLRSWCIEFGVRAAHALVASCSGAANMATHPAQRLLREAMFYTVQAQTQEVMDATLARLEIRSEAGQTDRREEKRPGCLEGVQEAY